MDRDDGARFPDTEVIAPSDHARLVFARRASIVSLGLGSDEFAVSCFCNGTVPASLKCCANGTVFVVPPSGGSLYLARNSGHLARYELPTEEDYEHVIAYEA